MRTLWTALSVVAVANLLALLGLAGWLRASDRLDVGRVREIRVMLGETLTQAKAREDEAKAKVEAEERAAKAKEEAAKPPIGAAETLDLKLEQSKADQERMEAMRRETKVLQETLKRERAALDAQWAALNKAKGEFEAARKAVVETEGNAQFKKALSTLESLKPDKAKAALQDLIDSKQVDQAVSYLNAMQERTRTKVIDEFLKSDPKVATDLLERLRTRGVVARGPEAPAG